MAKYCGIKVETRCPEYCPVPKEQSFRQRQNGLWPKSIQRLSGGAGIYPEVEIIPATTTSIENAYQNILDEKVKFRYVNAAFNVGVTPIEIKEILYQSVSYVSISKVIDFINVTNEIFTERNILLPLESQSTTTPEIRMEKRLAKQKEIIGDRVDDMYKNSPKNLLQIQEYLSANCFGDYITRDGLDLKNTGNNRQILIDLMTQLLSYVGYPRTLNTLNCLNEITLLK